MRVYTLVFSEMGEDEKIKRKSGMIPTMILQANRNTRARPDCRPGHRQNRLTDDTTTNDNQHTPSQKTPGCP
jgi:hypothetical protein